METWNGMANRNNVGSIRKTLSHFNRSLARLPGEESTSKQFQTPGNAEYYKAILGGMK